MSYLQICIKLLQMLQNPAKRENEKAWSLGFQSASLALRLVADGGSDLTFNVLLLAVDDEQQRRVHSYTSKIK